MRSEFNTSWVSSKQPRRQRKYLANAPLHLRHKFLSANLSKSLRAAFGRKSLPVRKGDEVLVMRGAFKKKTGKIVSVNLKRTRVTVEGLQRTKKDGTKVNVYFHPSVLQIQEITSSDKERSSISKMKSKTTQTPVQTPTKQKSKEDKNAPNKG